MVQVDLITGFLGAGKTTFLRRYVRYLVEQPEMVMQNRVLSVHF